MAADLDKLYTTIDRKRNSYLEVLKEAVAIESVQGDQYGARNILSWAENKLKELDFSTTLQDVGTTVIGGRKTALPPVLIADMVSHESKVKLLVYGHLDVRPSFKPRLTDTSYESGDSTSLAEEDGVLFGNGVTDSKGPLLCWFNALQAYQDQGIEVPISIRFVIEAMKESGSMGLLKYIHENKAFLFKNVSHICISDSSCLGSTKPVITYGLRGCCKFTVTIEGGTCNLHSGVHGGMVHEPMADLIYILSSLTNTKGDILIPNIGEQVESVTYEEERAYHQLSFDVGEFKSAIGVSKLLHKDDKKRLLMHRSRFPSLSIHGISTGDGTPSDSIPCKVTGSFTIRIVPNQTPEEVFYKTQKYLMYLFGKVQSPNQMTIEMPVAIPPWLAKTDDDNYKAAARAIHKVFKQEPELVREGSSIPIVAELQNASKKSVLLLPVGCSAHCVPLNRDRIHVKTFMDGTKVVATYIYELSQLTKGTKISM